MVLAGDTDSKETFVQLRWEFLQDTIAFIEYNIMSGTWKEKKKNYTMSEFWRYK